MWIQDLGSEYEVNVLIPTTIKVTAFSADDAEDKATMIADEIVDRFPADAIPGSYTVGMVTELEKVELIHGDDV